MARGGRAKQRKGRGRNQPAPSEKAADREKPADGLPEALPPVGAAALVFVAAGAVLSAVSPAVAHLQLQDLHASGTVVGSLSAWATAGALIGTFGTGFVLVPLISVNAAVLIIGVALVLVGLALAASSRLLSLAGVVVFVGGGGFTLPRWLNATRPGSSAHVLEVDGELVEFDEENLGLRTTPPLTVAIGDARVGMLDVETDSADVVVGDLIDSLPLDLLRAEAATLLDTFADVRLVTFGIEERAFGGNGVLLASDQPIPSAAGYESREVTTVSYDEVRSFAEDAEVLHDEFAPADQLLTSP